MKTIQNLTDALAYFTTFFGGRFVRDEKGALGPMAFVLVDRLGNKVFLFFKRGWLHSYGRLFPGEKWQGWGQTLNLAILKKAAAEKASIVIVMQEGEIYVLDAGDWLTFAETHKTVRTPTDEIGQEASIPAPMLRRVKVEPA